LKDLIILIGKNHIPLQFVENSWLKKCHYATTSFDLWMSKVGHDIFALVINFLGDD
jgi:hypothetical protein